jgi:hypothetical protein
MADELRPSDILPPLRPSRAAAPEPKSPVDASSFFLPPPILPASPGQHPSGAAAPVSAGSSAACGLPPAVPMQPSPSSEQPVASPPAYVRPAPRHAAAASFDSPQAPVHGPNPAHGPERIGVPPPLPARAAPNSSVDSPRQHESEASAPPPGASPPLPAVDSAAPASSRHWLEGSAAFLASMVVHLGLLIGLALINYTGDDDSTKLPPKEPIVLDMPSDAQDEQQPVADEFHSDVQMSAAVTMAALAEVPRVGTSGVASGRMISSPVLDAELLVADLQGAETAVDFPTLEVPDAAVIASGVPDGAAGDPRVVVRNYDQALDRITEEVVWMLSKNKVLLVWCFDQSESMKDDQAEIRERIGTVYEELGLREETAGDALTSAVVSYGEGFFKHMRREPSSDVLEIRKAIESVPSDPSGKEIMCTAVLRAINLYSGYAQEQDRQMAMILVTDESGERPDNLQALEQAIAMAREHRCRVYVLGREAVFGYPYAHMKWVHPQTRQTHWLPIDRGPETAFVEQLQADGFQKRTDAHPSGFGPYEQTRLARETGGIFFMLPSLETDLVEGERGDYEMNAMRLYRPDLRSRQELYGEVAENPLRLSLLKIVDELNPDKPEVANVMGVRFRFAADKFLAEVGEEQAKAMRYLSYLDAKARELESLETMRQQEISPRWQANYDLIRAQVLAYMARRYEYNARLDRFVRDLRTSAEFVPVEKPGFMKLSGFHVVPSSETVGGQITDSLIARSTDLFRKLIDDHPGTPWARRAERELQRGFGFALAPQYRYTGPPPARVGGGGVRIPQPQPRPQAPTIPIPRL